MVDKDKNEPGRPSLALEPRRVKYYTYIDLDETRRRMSRAVPVLLLNLRRVKYLLLVSSPCPYVHRS